MSYSIIQSDKMGMNAWFCLFVYRATASVMLDYYCRASELPYISGSKVQSAPL